MDLLEIRKKAKDKKKDEEGRPAPDALAEGSAPAPEEGAQAPVSGSVPKKTVRKRKKAPREKPAAPEAAPPEAPEPGAAVAVASGPEVEAPVQAPAKARIKAEGPPPEVRAAAGEEAVPGGAGGEDEVVEYLAFLLADEEYAVKVEDVREIIRYQKATTVPRTAGFVIGIISLRGVILPVFDVKRRLGLKDGGRTRSTRIVVISDKGAPQGIVVDKVTGVVRLKKGGIEPPPSVIGGVEAEFIEGVGRIGDRLLILFSTSRVLSTGE